MRLGAAIAERGGHPLEVVKRPPGLAALLASLRTLSLFSATRTVVVVESAVLADRSAAAELVDEAAEADPEEGSELDGDERRAAGRLLQALRLFGVDPRLGDPQRAVAALPDWAFQGGRMRRSRQESRGRQEVKQVRERLARLLAAARATDLRGFPEGDVEELSELARGGFPPGHTLVLAESAVALDHPLVDQLRERGALVELDRVALERGSWRGLEEAVAALERETGVGITPEGARELARRTLQTEESRGRPKAPRPVQADSMQRFAAEYGKLAVLSGEGSIGRELVEETVVDRGDQDVWKILDAIGQGDAATALTRVERYLAAAEDPIAARLSLFGTLATFARHLTAVAGAARAGGVPRGDGDYDRFEERWAPVLQQDRPYGAASPLRGVNAYRLHRAYLAASRMPGEVLARLPQRVLEAELLLKGGSRRADVVLSELAAGLAVAGR